jgi:hypothetical protein
MSFSSQNVYLSVSCTTARTARTLQNGKDMDRRVSLVSTVLFSAALAACGGSIGGDASGGGSGGADAGDGGGGGGGGGDADANTCARINVDVSEQIPTVLLLIDRSGSMTSAFGNTDRWSATYDTLMNPTTGVVKRLEGGVRFGAALYTSKNGFGGTESLEGQAAGTCPMLAEVAPALGNHAAIDAVYSNKAPIDDTPTGASIVEATDRLDLVAEPGPKLIVLATDGLPDSCTFPDPANDTEAQSARDEAIAAAQAAYQKGIETRVISVGDQVGAAHLQDMANAGAGLDVGGATNATFYEALNPDDLVAAFDDIINGVRSCVLTLDGQVDPDSASSGIVTFDGQELQQGTDWRLNDPSTIEILGASCDALLAGGDHTIDASFECGAIIN